MCHFERLRGLTHSQQNHIHHDEPWGTIPAPKIDRGARSEEMIDGHLFPDEDNYWSNLSVLDHRILLLFQ